MRINEIKLNSSFLLCLSYVKFLSKIFKLNNELQISFVNMDKFDVPNKMRYCAKF